MYRLVVSDLDETLLNHDRRVSEEDKAAIARLRELGVKFVPASGRGYCSIDGTLRELGLYNAAGEYVISFNGGAITENHGHRLVHFAPMPFETADELYRRGLHYDVCIHVYTKDTVYVYNFFPDEQAYLAGRMEVTEVFEKNLDFLRGQEIVKCLYTNTDHAYLEGITRELSSLTGNLDVSYSSGRYLEFNPKGVTKGTGLRRLAELLHIDIRDTIAIGDNYNDMPMIEAAGAGAGVRNMVEELKAQCDYVTAASCDQSAVAEVIHRFIPEAFQK